MEISGVHYFETIKSKATNKRTTSLRSQTALDVNKNSSEEAVLIRLLLGTIDFSRSDPADRTPQRNNMFVLGMPSVNITSQTGVSQALKQLDIDIKDLNIYLQGSISQRILYKELVCEASFYFSAQNSGNYVVAFLHIYRFLERISFVFPLIYATSTKDFKAAYSSLKDFFSGGDKASELNFFNKFIDTSIDPLLKDASTTIDLNQLDVLARRSVYKVIESLLDRAFIISSTRDTEFIIQNKGLLELLITLRNRFFHFLSGNPKNISLLDLSQPESLFQVINPQLFNWICVIYLEVLRKRLG